MPHRGLLGTVPRMTTPPATASLEHTDAAPARDHDVATSPARQSMRSEWAGLPAGARAGAALLGLYILGVSVLRFWECLDPWVAETDWKQWVWQYWRYTIDGAFPAGHVITDYTFNAQPPLYHAVMSTLSRVFRPVVAANIVNWIAWALAVWAAVMAVRARSNLLVGLMGAALFVRDDVVHRITAGGYPRSFGPTLVLLFLAAWLAGRHRLVLLVLVVASALYPSVAVPCGLAYGLWTALTARRDSLGAWLRPNLEVVATGAIVGVLAQLQSFTAPEWWGSVVWAKDAGPELTAAGRTPWLPLKDMWPSVWGYATEPFTFSGWLPEGRAGAGLTLPWTQPTAVTCALVLCTAMALLVVVRRERWRADLAWVLAPASAAWLVLSLLAPAFFLPHKVSGAPSFNVVIALVGAAAMIVAAVRGRLPRELLLIFGTSVLAFWLARVLAFKLYLPHRMVQHTLPSIMTVSLCLLAWEAAGVLFAAERRRTLAVLVGLVLPVMVLSGDGLDVGKAYRSYAKDAPLYQWVEKNTKVTDQFAGNYRPLDEIPFFSARQVYVNWKMAHPFRKGFFEEIERRTLKMYDAFYCTDLKDLLAFADETGVAFFVVDRKLYKAVERGDGQLFEPMRSAVVRQFFEPRRERGFALQDPPREIVAFRHGSYSVISIDELRAYLASAPAAPAPSVP